ncbi:tyrosine-type recombinase/integrase [Lentibacillus cibarius]|uniref:Integrase n=1 Tax=Lentibacillus cibarius TaxID=2583219 RepID=A0A5S3QJ11_9BACI|nr:tyrosine-type recombinase/integrase [Lentibacillus cibarius]TMN21904.1 hypothetical protein FFL34_07090 [Lentibacillus cibarius]
MITAKNRIKQFIDEYHFRLENNTLIKYQNAIQQFLSFCNKDFDNITRKDVRDWQQRLNRNAYMPSTIHAKIAALKTFFSYCQEEKLVQRNPADDILLPKKAEPTPHYLTQERLVQLRNLVRGNLIQRAVIETFLTTGVRLRELTNMKLENVYWSERMMIIPEGKNKRERVILFTKDCAEHLNSYLQTRDDDLPYLFANTLGTRPLQPRTIQHWFENYRKELGFYLTVHTLRHTFAANLAQKGMALSSIQVLLGHENPENTQVYVNLYADAQKQLYDEWM